MTNAVMTRDAEGTDTSYTAATRGLLSSRASDVANGLASVSRVALRRKDPSADSLPTYSLHREGSDPGFARMSAPLTIVRLHDLENRQRKRGSGVSGSIQPSLEAAFNRRKGLYGDLTSEVTTPRIGVPEMVDLRAADDAKKRMELIDHSTKALRQHAIEVDKTPTSEPATTKEILFWIALIFACALAVAAGAWLVTKGLAVDTSG